MILWIALDLIIIVLIGLNVMNYNMNEDVWQV